jgi:hypothetical protein
MLSSSFYQNVDQKEDRDNYNHSILGKYPSFLGLFNPDVLIFEPVKITDLFGSSELGSWPISSRDRQTKAMVVYLICFYVFTCRIGVDLKFRTSRAVRDC